MSKNWMLIVEGRRQSLLMVSLITYPNNKVYFKDVGLDFELRHYKYVDGAVYMEQGEVQDLGRQIEANIRKNPRYLEDFAEKCHHACNQLLRQADEIRALGDFKNLSEEELYLHFHRYVSAVRRLMPYLFGIHPIEFWLEDKVRGLLARKLEDPHRVESVLNRLIIPSEEEEVVREIRHLLDIAVFVQDREISKTLLKHPVSELEEKLPRLDPELFDRLQRHRDEFGWMHQYCYLGEPTPLSELISRMRVLLKRGAREEKARVLNRERLREEEYQKAVQRLRLTSEELKLIQQTRSYIALRMKRINVYFIAHYRVMGFLREIAVRLDIPYEHLLFMTAEEIEKSLQKGKNTVPIPLLTYRQGGYALIMEDGERRVLVGEEIEALRREIERRRGKSVKTDVLEGLVACEGEAVGVVKLISLPEDEQKMEEGDILVATMTTPDLMPAIQKASGIITDEGGLLCHAAIVSRELGIPCIIGTQIATKVLKDGNRVRLLALAPRGRVELLKEVL